MKKYFYVFVVMLIISSYLFGQSDGSKIQMEISKGWLFSQAGTDKWYPAFSPGCVHTDLLNNRLIPDPYVGTNEKDLQWIGEKDWIYQTTFDVDKKTLAMKNIELDFKGLDTYADVSLNGTKILSADNMFREWQVDCKNLLKENGNLLSIHFKNVFTENLPKYNNAPYRLQSFDNNDQADIKINMYSRKAGFHFGWDWGPRLITCGIYKPIFLVAWNDIKLNDVQIIQKDVSSKNAAVYSNMEISSDKNQNATAEVMVNGRVLTRKVIQLVKGNNTVPLNFDLKNPRLWWPNGLGEQYLYRFRYTISSNTEDSKEYRIGIRSIEVVREKDSTGTSFYLKVNGVPVFAKGANYIPQDNFQNRVTPERYLHIIKSAADANMNILRVWGGGIYENDIFYDLCDKYGILVWQEFMFACGMYPSDEHYIDNIKHEVIDNVKRIRNHACLAIYCGNNENEISWFQWGWKQMYNEDIQKKYEADYKKIFYEAIPTTLKEVDNTRYYHPSSPSGGFDNFSYNDGDAHYWGVWHGKEPFESFNTNIARFMSEYGFQSYPEMSTIEKFAKPEEIQLHSEVMLAHQRCMADARKDKEYGNRLIQTYMERQFKQPKNFESYVYVSQVLQAEGIKRAILAHRRNMPKCMGTMYWQIDDCWPVASWSSIDYYGNWKALHYYVKRFYEPVIIDQEQKDNALDFYIISDKLEPLQAELKIDVYNFDGTEVYAKSVPVVVEANKSRIYLSIAKDSLIQNQDSTRLVVVSSLVSESKVISQNEFYFVKEKDLALERPHIDIEYYKATDGYTISLKTDKLAKDVFLSIDGNGFFADNYFDLLPGEKKQIELKTRASIDQLKKNIKVISLTDSF